MQGAPLGGDHAGAAVADAIPSPTDLGAAYGTAKSGVGICSMGVMHPGLIMKCKHPRPKYTSIFD